MIGASLDNGMLDHISTHGMIAALWNSSFYLGFMLGPLAGRLLIQSLGYRYATMLLTGMGLFCYSVYYVVYNPSTLKHI